MKKTKLPIVWPCTVKLSMFIHFKGFYWAKRDSGIAQLQKEFWPNGLDKAPVLDYTQYWLVYETDKGDFVIIDGNHRKILLEECGIEVWPCRWIPKQAVSNIFFYYATLYGAFSNYFSILPNLKFKN